MKKDNTIATVDLGTLKSAIAILNQSEKIYIDSIYTFNYAEPSIFLNKANDLLKEINFDNIVIEIPRKLQGKEHISKEAFTRINKLTDDFLDITEKISEIKPFSIYTSYATNKFGYSKSNGNTDRIGWRQRLTGLARPNEKDIFYHLQLLEDNEEIEFSDKALDIIYRNQNRKIFYDIIDAAGLGITFYKYPDVFEKYSKEKPNKKQKNLKRIFGKNISEDAVKEINSELYKVFLGN